MGLKIRKMIFSLIDNVYLLSLKVSVPTKLVLSSEIDARNKLRACL